VPHCLDINSICQIRFHCGRNFFDSPAASLSVPGARAKLTIASNKAPGPSRAEQDTRGFRGNGLADYFRCTMARAILPTIARSLCERIRATLNAQAAMHPMVPTMTSAARPLGAE
jgi:hypothetical protein